MRYGAIPPLIPKSLRFVSKGARLIAEDPFIITYPNTRSRHDSVLIDVLSHFRPQESSTCPCRTGLVVGVMGPFGFVTLVD